MCFKHENNYFWESTFGTEVTKGNRIENWIIFFWKKSKIPYGHHNSLVYSCMHACMQVTHFKHLPLFCVLWTSLHVQLQKTQKCTTKVLLNSLHYFGNCVACMHTNTKKEYTRGNKRTCKSIIYASRQVACAVQAKVTFSKFCQRFVFEHLPKSIFKILDAYVYRNDKCVYIAKLCWTNVEVYCI